MALSPIQNEHPAFGPHLTWEVLRNLNVPHWEQSAHYRAYQARLHRAYQAWLERAETHGEHPSLRPVVRRRLLFQEQWR
jgi:hypothetical protein